MKNSTNIRAVVQAFGGFLTNMVIPNIGAFIAWGILTALFIPTGWIPNDTLGSMVGPTIKYLLPLLLAHTGGGMIAGYRGSVMGTLGTIGLIIGSDIPMFLGAMIVGPLGGWIIKKWDNFIDSKIPVGFEMLVNNFSLGIIGFTLMILSFSVIGPVIVGANEFVTNAIQALVSTGFLPLLSLINEPAKVLFLNNVIDQGIYYPLGMQQSVDIGKSIYFMVASNPGPGLGLLIAYALFGSKTAKLQAPGAMIIHFLGGIHELYFPFVLMKPITIVSMILGGMSGTLIFQLTGTGLVAGPSPGSIFAYLALTPRGDFFGVILGVLVATLVSFAVTSLILKVQKVEDEEESFEAYQKQSKKMKQEGKSILSDTLISHSLSLKIAFACDAGMGSSAMGATSFKKRITSNNINSIEVKHYRIEDVPKDTDIIVVHEKLKDRLLMIHDDKFIITITNFLQDRNLDDLLDDLIAKQSSN